MRTLTTPTADRTHAVPLPGVGVAASRAQSRKVQQAARGTYAVPKGKAAALPSAQTRHMLSRFTGAVTAQRVADVTAAGGIDAWFEKQLVPASIPDPQGDALWGWFPALALTPVQKWASNESGKETGWQMMADLANWHMMRRLVTNRQVEEMMVDFWSNLLHVASPEIDVWVWRVEYQTMIRSHALGTFDALLQAAIQHPAMGLYLSNTDSTADAINENLGREVLECHTVGVGAGYTETDVVNSAQILTGFHVDRGNTWAASYVPGDHWTGRVKVLRFSSPNAQADGRTVLSQYLSYLANHPATAKRLCQRLAVRFMSDTPSHALVNALAKVYLDSKTAIVPVLRALVASAEFQASILKKVRTPVEDTVATFSTVRAVVTQPHQLLDAGNQLLYISKGVGQVVYDWPTPDGFPDVAPAWTDSGRVLGSMRAHWRAAGGYYPVLGITYPKPIDYMPALPATFAAVVDYLARTTLFLAATPTMIQAACVATDIKSTDSITSTHALITYKFPRLLVSLLDTPEHLSR